jgi:hypothetical protein
VTGHTTALLERAQENRLRIIESVLVIEKRLNTLLAHYFFSDAGEQRSIFTSLVLNSDWCTFASKRNLLRHLVNLKDWIAGQAKNDFDCLLRDVMSYRNAFTHGMLSADAHAVRLSYFEGGPQECELTDEFLAEIEARLCEAHDVLLALSSRLGVPAAL